MLSLNEFKSILANLQDPDIKIDEAVNYLMSHQYIDDDFLNAFGEMRQALASRSYKYILYSFVALNRQAGHKLSVDDLLSIAQFIFYEGDYMYTSRRENLDFVDFLRMYAKIYTVQTGHRNPFMHMDFMPMNLSPLYAKLATLNQTYGLDVKTILNYCYSQTSCEASGELFDLWYSYVTDIPHEKNESLTPKNLLYAYNLAAMKNNEQATIFKLTQFSGGQFFFRKQGKNIIVRAAIPVNPETNEVAYEWIKLWVDHVGEIEVKSLADHKRDNDIPFGSLLYELTIPLTPNSLVMVDDNDVGVTPRLPNQVRQSLFAGTDWICFYEGPSRININRSRLIELRKARGLTQKEAAVAVNTSPRTFQNWESKKSGASPDMDSLIRLMFLYDVSDIKAFIEVKKFFDIGDEKFRSGASLEEMYPLHYNGELEPMEGLLAVLEEFQKETDKKGGD